MTAHIPFLEVVVFAARKLLPLYLRHASAVQRFDGFIELRLVVESYLVFGFWCLCIEVCISGAGGLRCNSALAKWPGYLKATPAPAGPKIEST